MITSMKRGIYIYMHVQNAPSQLRNILYCKGHTLILITNIKDVALHRKNKGKSSYFILSEFRNFKPAATCTGGDKSKYVIK